MGGDGSDPVERGISLSDLAEDLASPPAHMSGIPERGSPGIPADPEPEEFSPNSSKKKISFGVKKKSAADDCAKPKPSVGLLLDGGLPENSRSRAGSRAEEPSPKSSKKKKAVKQVESATGIENVHEGGGQPFKSGGFDLNPDPNPNPNPSNQVDSSPLVNDKNHSPSTSLLAIDHPLLAIPSRLQIPSRAVVLAISPPLLAIRSGRLGPRTIRSVILLLLAIGPLLMTHLVGV